MNLAINAAIRTPSAAPRFRETGAVCIDIPPGERTQRPPTPLVSPQDQLSRLQIMAHLIAQAQPCLPASDCLRAYQRRDMSSPTLSQTALYF